MITLTDGGFETLAFKTTDGAAGTHEFDLFKLHGEMIELGGDLPDSEFFALIARHLERMLLPATAKLSNAQAEQVYRDVRAKVAELKKNVPCLNSAVSPESTASPSGHTPGVG